MMTKTAAFMNNERGGFHLALATRSIAARFLGGSAVAGVVK